MTETPNEKDPVLWKQAKKRVAFRRHLFSYIIINGFIWALWFFTGREEEGNGFPWPVWPTAGWGIGLAFNFYDTYFGKRTGAVEREYDKLKNKQ